MMELTKIINSKTVKMKEWKDLKELMSMNKINQHCQCLNHETKTKTI